MIVITGATGRTGRVAAETLIAGGEKIRLVGRDPKRLEALAQGRAETFVGNAHDAASMTMAFKGADAVYLVVPEDVSVPDLRGQQERVTDAFAAAIANSRVPYVVPLSSMGAQHSQGTGPIVGLHNMEQKLNRIAGVNVLCLRAGYFMENLFMSIAPLRAMGTMPGGMVGDVAMPWIATRDIGAYAAKRLAARDFSGSSVQELHGQRDISMNEAASIVGAAIGNPNLQYTQVPLAPLEATLVQMGLPKTTAALVIEMWKGANAGLMAPLQHRSGQDTTPTTIEWFVKEVFAPVYNAKTSAGGD